MQEKIPNPFCMACGNHLELTKSSPFFRYECKHCSFGNYFRTAKVLLCSVCFSDVTVIRDKHIRITLCSDPACPSYIESERGNFRFRTIRHKNFNNQLDWYCAKNYFLFYDIVNMNYHNYLVSFVNNIIDAQGWNWTKRPAYINL